MGAILKQASWLFFAQAAARVISFFYTFFLAQNLGVNDFGLYTVALAYFSLTSTIADFGFNRFLIREISKDERNTSVVLFTTTLLRLVVAVILFSLFAITLYLLDENKFRVSISLFAILAIFPQSIALSLDAVFVAVKKMQYSAINVVVLSVVTTVLGVAFINKGVFGVITALIIGQVVYLAVAYLFFRIQKIQITKVSDFGMVREVLIGSFPYGLLGMLGFIYFKVDTLMLSYLKGNYETGIYGVAYKFLEAIIFIPSALGAALFPVLAQLHTNNIEEMKRVYLKSFMFMAIFSLFIVAGYLLILPYLITMFLPNYLPAIDTIRILSLTIPFMFIHTPGVQILLATDKYIKTVVFLSVITLSFNVILNLIFIPKYGHQGAAWVTVFSEALSFLVFYVILQIKVFKKTL